MSGSEVQPADATVIPQTPSSLASFISRLASRFWYRLTQVVLEKRPLNGCSSSGSSGPSVSYHEVHEIVCPQMCGIDATPGKVARHERLSVVPLGTPAAHSVPVSTSHYTDDARYWVRHSNMMNQGWKCRTRAQPDVTFSTEVHHIWMSYERPCFICLLYDQPLA